MSLSEMLVTILILVIIISLLIGMYFTYIGAFKIQMAYNELNSNSIIAFDKITSRIKGAARVAEQATINSIEYTTDYDTLILELPSIDEDQNIIFGAYDYFVIYRDPADNTLLKFDIEPDTGSSRQSGARLVSEYVDEIIFNFNNIDYTAVNKIETILVTKQDAGRTEQVIIMQNTTKIRNK
ncbi:hypothetical protein KKF61_01755 [Patescibacteria group bacterium]|nr:hypothetical protein [Patescibacteria group bacterium]MBU0964630.1 hypothetical protein [Patescibacteria group bacterium]